MSCLAVQGRCKEKGPSEDSTSGDLALFLRTAINYSICRPAMRGLLQSGRTHLIRHICFIKASESFLMWRNHEIDLILSDLCELIQGK